MELERQHEREGKDKEENAQREATGNKEEERRTQLVVTVEIPRRRKASVMPVTRDGEDGDLRMKDSEKTTAAEGQGASHHATTERIDTTPSINEDSTI